MDAWSNANDMSTSSEERRRTEAALVRAIDTDPSVDASTTHAALCRYVDLLAGEGLLPEAVVIAFKSALGRAESLHVSVTPPPLPPPKEHLNVAARFGRKLDSATEARVAREGALAAAVGRRSHDSPPRWTLPFLRPRASAVSSGFGTGRMFNGQVASRHLGVDFRGATGAPIRAANRGVVVLVDTFFLAGRCVYIDHGGGVTTGYFHMSKPLVSVGDTVKRGQTIGLVGATGRVTGPHLHWAARYGALTVNPLGLLTLGDSTRRATPPIPHVQRRRPRRAP